MLSFHHLLTPNYKQNNQKSISNTCGSYQTGFFTSKHVYFFHKLFIDYILIHFMSDIIEIIKQFELNKIVNILSVM